MDDCCDCDADFDAEPDCAGIFTPELQSEIWSLMVSFMNFGSDYLEAGEEAVAAVSGDGLVTNKDDIEEPIGV